MLYRSFGDSDLRTSAIGFGGWPMGGTQYGPVEDSDAIRAIGRALDAGVTCFDNAAGYGLGHSERVMGRALKPHRDEIVLITKCGVRWNEEVRRMERISSRESVTESFENSLRNLDTDHLDLLLVHWPDPRTPFEETMTVLGELQAAGKVRYLGVSNFMPEMIDECLRHVDLVCNQVGYSLFERRIEADVLPYCGRHGLGIMAYGSLAHGLLSGAMRADAEFEDWDWRSTGNAFGMPMFARGRHFERNVHAADRLRAIAERTGHTLPELAVAWVLRREVVTTALVGFRTPAEVDQAVRAAGWEVPEEVLAEVDAISDAAYERLVADQDMAPEKGGWNPWNRDPPRFGGHGKPAAR